VVYRGVCHCGRGLGLRGSGPAIVRTQLIIRRQFLLLRDVPRRRFDRGRSITVEPSLPRHVTDARGRTDGESHGAFEDPDHQTTVDRRAYPAIGHHRDGRGYGDVQLRIIGRFAVPN
jgi:hypothetical protein